MSRNLKQRMIEDMRLRGLAQRTQDRYLHSVKTLAKHYQCPLDELSQEQVRDYLIYMLETKKYAKSTYKANLYAIKFLYKRTLGRKWETLDITRVKSDKKLPVVLSREEVWSLLALVRREPIHMCLTLMYTCGLRVSEAVHIRIEDIDSKRMVLWVRNSKGNKDRSVPLPTETLAQLRAYWVKHRSETWLFPGKDGIVPMNIATVQHGFKATVQQSRINKNVSCHTLRHSYATHLLEAGVHLRAIQAILGHRSISTTFVYMHLTQGTLVDVQAKVNELMKRH
ncbi:tyrosine-type recombinase/integrase [Planctomycetota bacterium]